MSGDQFNPSGSIMAGVAPNMMNPGAAMQQPSGLMGQSVGVRQKPVMAPVRSPEEAMMQALMRRMEG